jgi:hypothetical protein
MIKYRINQNDIYHKLLKCSKRVLFDSNDIDY